MAGIWWLASYPKSGNTWLRVVLASLSSGRPADFNSMPLMSLIATNRTWFDKAIGLESADLTIEQEFNLRPRAYEIWAAEAQQPLYCKAHDAYLMTPAGEPLFPTAVTLGAVYIVRDPRAVAVSYANHLAETIDETIVRMDDRAPAASATPGRLPRHQRPRLGAWRDHVESWLRAPFPVHLMRYEDMHRDPHDAFGRVAAFLGLPRDGEKISAAVDAASFARLQEQERATGFIEKPRRATAFFREGTVDGWRQSLLPEQAARIAAANGDTMRRCNYDTLLMPLPTERHSNSAA